MISVTQVSNAALSSGSVDVRSPSTTVARQPVKASSASSTQSASSNQPVLSNQPGDTKTQQPGSQEVQRAVAQANAQIAGLNESLSFGFIKELGQLVVQVTDKNSGEVIRQFPSREFIAQQIASKAFLGMLLDKQV